MAPDGGSEKKGGAEHPCVSEGGVERRSQAFGVVSTTKKGTQPRECVAGDRLSSRKHAEGTEMMT